LVGRVVLVCDIGVWLYQDLKFDSVSISTD